VAISLLSLAAFWQDTLSQSSLFVSIAYGHSSGLPCQEALTIAKKHRLFLSFPKAQCWAISCDPDVTAADPLQQLLHCQEAVVND